MVATATLLLLLLVYSLFDMGREDEGKEETSDTAKEELSILLPGCEGLERSSVVVERGLSDEQRAKVIVEALKKKGALSPDTQLLDLGRGEEGTIYVNLSSGLFLGISEPMEEIRGLYGLVNSLVHAFPGSQKVQILVDGKALHTISGILYTYKPLEALKEAE